MLFNEKDLELPSKLTKGELFALGFLSFKGNVFSVSELVESCKKFKVGSMDSATIARYVTDDYDYGYWSRLRLNRFFTFQIIFQIISKYPNFIKVYETNINFRDRVAKNVWEAAYFVYKMPGHKIDDDLLNDFVNTTSAYNIYSYIDHFIYHQAIRPLISRLNSLTFRGIIANKLNCEIIDNYDEFNCGKLIELVDYFSKSDNTNLDTLKDAIKAVQFTIDGQIPKFQEKSNEWVLAVNAVIELYKGEVEKAYSIFQSSLRLYNKSNSEKNYYYINIFTFYLVLCYCRMNNTDARKKISILLNKESLTQSLRHWPAVCFARFVGQNEDIQNLINSSMRRSNFAKVGLNTCCMVNIIRHFFKGVYDLKFNIPSNIDNLAPKSILLRHELSNFIKNNKIKDETDILGGKPVVSYLRMKPYWESSIEEIFDLIPKNSDSQNNEKPENQKRLIYVINDNSYVDILEQKMKRNGEWTSGTTISFSSFISDKLTYLDSQDKSIAKLHSNVNPRGYYMSKANVLPYLIGSERVFYRNNKLGLDPVYIGEEKAYFSVKKAEKGGFVISNNLPDGNIAKTVIRKNSNTDYTIFNLTDVEYQILSKLSNIKNLPTDSEDMLMTLFQKLNGIVEVHSPLIKGGSMLEKVKSDNKVILQLKPTSNDTYNLTIFTRPLPDGKLEFIPGEGKAIIFDSDSQKRFQVERNLKKEKEIYELLTESLYSIEEAEETDPGKWILSPQGMLDVINIAKENDKLFNVEWPQGQSVKIKTTITTSMVSATIKHNESWFEMEGKVDVGQKDVLTLQQLLTLFNEKRTGKYIQLSDDEFIILEDSLKKQLQKLSDISTSNKRISIFQVGSIAELAYGDDPLLKTDSKFKELEQKMQKASKLDPKIPTNLDAELRDYQVEGFKWMAKLSSWGAGACLADDMGLGKTIQTITLMLYRKGPSLIVAPASVVLNWCSEIEKFAPSLNTYILNETGSREDVIEKASKGDVVLCSYGILQREEELIEKKNWDLVCLDEAHVIKNHGTKTSSAAMKIKANARIALTGTPIQNNLSELWNIYQFLNPGLLGSYETFCKRFLNTDNKGNIRRLKAMIQPFMLRRRKSDVIEELPEKTDVRRMIELSKNEIVAYEAIRESTKQALQSTNKVDVSILAQITKLRQAACSMKLIEANWSANSSKEEYAVELLSQITEGGNKVLVFSQFTSFLTMVRDLFVKNTEDKVPYLYLDGSTTIRKREEMVTKFQEGEIPVFFISLKAGGLGLNLTGANYVIHLDPWWNPAIEAQATDRAHRIGQKQNVTVYHLLCNHTIEEKILRLHKKKQDIADFLMEGTNVTTSLTIDDLRNLVSND